MACHHFALKRIFYVLSCDTFCVFDIAHTQQIEDGWWMGVKNGQVGAFPSNFVKEIFMSPKGW